MYGNHPLIIMFTYCIFGHKFAGVLEDTINRRMPNECKSLKSFLFLEDKDLGGGSFQSQCKCNYFAYLLPPVSLWEN